MLLAATGDVAPGEAGLASGVVNTSFMMGGALGLAVLAGVAASRSRDLLAAGHGQLTALTGGYHAAFGVAAVLAALAALLGARLLRGQPAGLPRNRRWPGGGPASATPRRSGSP